ncbi:hypothetical protein V5799_014649 [Amblyomma americanum]|uniref:RNA-dependent RNA polymerase n=1 Tax=Amblyomma americanum TaxID=6943 RepID=A0AAQ4E2F2_AMBAM
MQRTLQPSIACPIRPGPLFLNRQLITLLEQLGVPSRVLFCLQQRMVTLLTEALVSDSVALQVLETTSMGSLLSKTRIAVPRNLGRNMFGVLDETRTLKYGQVFVQFTSLGSSTRQKNGPQVFILSGSNLDGDEYIVFWDRNLFFPGPNQEPMIYGQKVQQQRSEMSLVDGMAKFISDYIKDDNVGVMSNAHLALADKLKDGVFSKQCLSIAAKISTCLDFAKTGVAAVLEKHERPREYTDFMAKGCHKITYRSNRVFGHLYRLQRFLESVVSTSFNSHQVDGRSNIKLLEFHSWMSYRSVVEELRASYESDMDRILKQYGIKTEAEVVSGFINDTSSFNKSHYEKNNVEVLVTKQYRAIAQSTRERFFEKVEEACYLESAFSTEEKTTILLRMASACFMVAYSNAHKTCSSFPWIFSDLILLVMATTDGQPAGSLVWRARGSHSARRGPRGCRHIVVSSVGRDWQRWFLEELLLQPWLATAVKKRSLEQFIRG